MARGLRPRVSWYFARQVSRPFPNSIVWPQTVSNGYLQPVRTIAPHKVKAYFSRDKACVKTEQS